MLEIHVNSLTKNTNTDPIVAAITDLIGVTACKIDVENGVVYVDGFESNLELITSILHDLGFHEKNKAEEFDKMSDTAKDYVAEALKKLRDKK